MQLTTVLPRQAAHALRDDRAAEIALIPDLFPPNIGFDHKTAEELERGIRKRFDSAAGTEASLRNRFHVFCFKFDFEVLLLAAKEQLQEYLQLELGFDQPCEDINHDNPPKGGSRIFSGRRAENIKRRCTPRRF